MTYLATWPTMKQALKDALRLQAQMRRRRWRWPRNPRLERRTALILALFAVGCSPMSTQRAAPAPEYWLWILNVGEAHSTHPYSALEECRRSKEGFINANRAVFCLTVSPYGRGPFYLYLYQGAAFEQMAETPPFTSLDDCDVEAQPWKRRNVVVACGPASLEEPL